MRSANNLGRSYVDIGHVGDGSGEPLIDGDFIHGARHYRDITADTEQTIDRLIQAEAQRDELLAALKDLVEVNERIGAPPIQQGTLCEENDWHYDMRKARAAIARADQSYSVDKACAPSARFGEIRPGVLGRA